MNNPSDDTPKKDPSESPVGINGARSQTVIVRNFVLAFTSGFIDALSFLGLGVFASVQTANTVLLGLSIGSENIL
ncbi:MAG: YoaK family protein, partial [Candidatus Nitrosopolaris sp.]